jgi:hypothetical protein
LRGALVAGHSFLVVGLFIILLALPLLATANAPAQRKLGKYWKRLQRTTYVIWGLVVLHLLLLDGFMPFGGPEGDGDPIMHQRFYQAVAISIPLIVLRLPPVRRWIADQRAAGRQRWVYLAFLPLAVLFILGFAYIINEEIFTGNGKMIAESGLVPGQPEPGMGWRRAGSRPGGWLGRGRIGAGEIRRSWALPASRVSAVPWWRIFRGAPSASR